MQVHDQIVRTKNIKFLNVMYTWKYNKQITIACETITNFETSFIFWLFRMCTIYLMQCECKYCGKVKLNTVVIQATNALGQLYLHKFWRKIWFYCCKLLQDKLTDVSQTWEADFQEQCRALNRKIVSNHSETKILNFCFEFSLTL